MLDKLNQIANLIQDAIAAHPSNQKKKAAEGSPDEEASESPAQEAGEDAAAAKTQKSMRKSFGGQKEPK